jgi:anti-sigma regulatory factor (Ser/Thr protein kinase)
MRDGLTGRTCRLQPDSHAARAARRFTRELCVDIGCDDLVGDASLVVTELVTNAVIHAATPSELRLRYADGVLRIEVADGNASRPRPRTPMAGDETGRGLLLIEALSRTWGCDADDAGKVVWAELAREVVNTGDHATSR